MKSTKDDSYDYIIIGAGPAGVQLAYYLEKAGRRYLILEADESPGSFFKTFPRHRQLISINKVYTGYDNKEVNLRWDWNSLLSDDDRLLLKNYTTSYFPRADDFVKYLSDFVNCFNLNVRYGARVRRVARDSEFRLTDEQGNVYSCRRLIVATGFAKPYLPPIPGIELAECYTEMSVKAEDFINQKVLVIGKGNSGFETANHLTETAAAIHIVSPNTLKMAWQTHFVGHLRAINNNLLDTYQLKSQNAVMDATVNKIERRGDKLAVSLSYAHADGEEEVLLYDRVLACTGFRFDATIFDETCRPALTINDRFPDQTSEWEATNVKDLYFAGTLTQMRDFKKTTSGFIHGFRYNVRALHRMLELKYHGRDWPGRRIDCTPQSLMEAVIKRINETSGLWQQFGFLCDLIAVSEDGLTAQYYEEMPVDYVNNSDFGASQHYYTVTLEYGPNHVFDNPFNVSRIARNDVNNAHQSNFLHPVLRRFGDRTLVSEHHVIEDLAAEWQEDEHILPLLAFFERELERMPDAATV